MFAIASLKKERGTSVIAFNSYLGPIWQGEDMKPSEMAARFAAFAWYAEQRQAPSRIVRNEAGRFSSQNWKYFLPAVHKGWGSYCSGSPRPVPTRSMYPQW